MAKSIALSLALSCAALLLADCTSQPPDAGLTDMAGADLSAPGSGPKDCTGCTGSQVCVEGACVDVPSACPCPKETYCDLAVNQCKVGCTNDGECSAGRICNDVARSCRTGCRKDEVCGAGNICDNTLCRPGCRRDTDCGAGNICDSARNTCQKGCRKDADCTTAGQICDTTSNTCQQGCRKDADCTTAGQICDTAVNMCRTGCRATATCPNEQICDMASKKCVAGCDSDARCNAGRICDKAMCTDGCRTSATCPLNMFCDTVTTKKCQPGCNHDKSRCAAGEACVDYVDGSSKCQAACYGYACNGAGWQCYEQNAMHSGARCRLTCSVDGDCPMGQRCTWFTTKQSTPGSYSVQYCAPPCTTAGCSTCVDSYGMFGTGVCNTTTKACTYLGMYTCYQTSPSYGL